MDEIDVTAKGIRKWLNENNYPVSDGGRISTEMRDIWKASTLKLVPEGMNVVAYVGLVRQWANRNGIEIPGSVPLSRDDFREYNIRNDPEQVTFGEVATHFLAEEQEYQRLMAQEASQRNEADRKAREAADADRQHVKRGLAKVEAVLRHGRRDLIRESLRQAMDLSGEAFEGDELSEDAYFKFEEAFGCVKVAYNTILLMLHLIEQQKGMATRGDFYIAISESSLFGEVRPDQVANWTVRAPEFQNGENLVGCFVGIIEVDTTGHHHVGQVQEYDAEDETYRIKYACDGNECWHARHEFKVF